MSQRAVHRPQTNRPTHRLWACPLTVRVGLIVAVALSAACGGGASPSAPATPPPTSSLDTAGFLEFQAGTAPLVIVAPHGGSLKPVNIPDRTCAGCETGTDLNTEDLALRIADAFARRTGRRPFLAMNHLARIKFDGNRAQDEATGSHTVLNGVWNTWQDNLDSATARAARLHNNRGLYIEMHGHGHPIARIELGYLLTDTQLRLSDAGITVGGSMRQSSIARLVSDTRSGASDVALLRGAPSLGALLYAAGFPAVPSPADQAPKLGDPYFNGGYNTVRHGSLNGGATDAIQAECYYTGLRDTAESRAAFAEAFAAILEEFLKKQYGWPSP